MPPSSKQSAHVSAAERQRDAAIEESRHGRDLRLAELAARQRGVAAHHQLLGVGFSTSGVRRAVVAGRLHRVHRGVYAVGHPALGREGRWLAAVLACGPAAVLSHRSAAALWDLRSFSRARIDITTRRHRIAPPGIDLHQPMRLGSDEITARDGIAVTTVARTLADLAGVLRPRDLERTLERAQTLQVLDVPSLLASVRDRRGAVAVRRILTAWEPRRTKSELEVALLRLVERSGLPRPEVSARVGEFEVDLLWRAARVGAEADSLQFHLSRAAMERDRRRDAVLAGAGFRLLRFTDRQVRSRPHEVLDALRCALTAH